MTTEHTFTDMTHGGICNIAVNRVRGNVERSGIFSRVAAGMQILCDIKSSYLIACCIVQNKISRVYFEI